jgi:hypothetical protein
MGKTDKIKQKSFTMCDKIDNLAEADASIGMHVDLASQLGLSKCILTP